MGKRSELAGRPAPPELLVDLGALERAYFDGRPDAGNAAQRVTFGTSGHRGTSFDATFTEAHILAITQAICEFRRQAGIDGPLYVGMDTHALSAPAHATALEVLAGNEVTALVQVDGLPTPTPVISRAILAHNAGRSRGLADGIVITPSHNPPTDGGFKYNGVNGGPADTDATRTIQERANELLAAGNADVRRAAVTARAEDFVSPYVEDLAAVLDLEAIRAAGVRIGVDPLGGAAWHYWGPIAERYRLDIGVVNPTVDPAFGFMTVDHDGRIRMDCSSPDAMAGLLAHKERFPLAFGNDPDADRHGIVTPAGLMNPNHYLAVAIAYLLGHRPDWSPQAAIGKTVVSSVLIDRVVAAGGRRLLETPVGFKWFAPGLFDGSVCFGGEESAGASFVRRDGRVWSTDKDGLILGLLAAEITAVTGRDPGEHYRALAERFGEPHYTRIDAPASPEKKARLARLAPGQVAADTLAGDPITQRITAAPGNGAPLGGLKVCSDSGWFAARPSGTENVYKIYAESLRGAEHLQRIVAEAQAIVDGVLG